MNRTLPFRRVSLRGATLLLAFVFVSPIVQMANAAWVPVMEDSANMKLTVSSLALDTTHFPSSVLLVGTYRDTSGLSLVMTVDPLTLEPIDTLYRSTYVPKVCRAADLNADSQVDLLVSLTSVAGDSARFSSLVAAYGPDFIMADTLSLPRAAVDLLVDDARREIWYGFAHDTTTADTIGSCITNTWQYVGFGGALTFDLAPAQNMGGQLAGLAFGVGDVNSDHVNDLVALWTWAQEDWNSGCGPQPAPSWAEVGVWLRDGASGDNLPQTFARYTNGFYYQYIQPYARLPLADLDLDGGADAILSWHHALPTGYDSLHTAAISLSSGAQLWSKEVPYPAFGIHDWVRPFTAIVYDLDQTAPPEVLLIGPYHVPTGYSRLLALRGATGDSLFAADFREVSSLNVTLEPAPDQRTRVIHASTSWLYRWRIDLGASVEDGSEEVIPNRFLLRANAPNPFNAETRISYTLAYPMAVEVSVYDALGRLVSKLVDDHQAGGDHTVVWNGISSAGQKVSSGVYFLRLSSGGEYLVRKMAMVK